MRILDINSLSDTLSHELSWRKKELTVLKGYVLRKETSQNVRLRSSICLLYAHFEGFTKQAVKAYLSFVSAQKLDLRELKEGFLGSFLHQKFSPIDSPEDMERLVLTIIKNRKVGVVFKFDDLFGTKSNLSYYQLQNILTRLGIKTNVFETKQKLIDTRLLAKRNHVAHGETSPVDEGDYLELHDAVMEMLSAIKNELENAAVTASYKIKSS